jgi:hypothetical protein
MQTLMNAVKTEMAVFNCVLILLAPISVAALLATDLILIGILAMVSKLINSLTQREIHGLTLLTDIDECMEDTDGCQQICTNSIGSYSCSCNIGYRLASDNRHCNGK